MSFPGLFNSTVDFKRIDLSSGDGMGGYDDTTLTTLYRRIPCYFEAVDRDQDVEIRAFDGTNVFPDHYLYLESLTGIKEGDHVFHREKEFEIKLIQDWAEQREKMKLFLVQINRGKT